MRSRLVAPEVAQLPRTGALERHANDLAEEGKAREEEGPIFPPARAAPEGAQRLAHERPPRLRQHAATLMAGTALMPLPRKRRPAAPRPMVATSLAARCLPLKSSRARARLLAYLGSDSLEMLSSSDIRRTRRAPWGSGP
jgi:hypothetical protein